MPRKSPFTIPWRMAKGPDSKQWHADIRHHIVMSSVPKSCSWPRRDGLTTRSPAAWTCHGRSLASGAKGFSPKESPACRTVREAVVPRLFPPHVVLEVKALA